MQFCRRRSKHSVRKFLQCDGRARPKTRGFHGAALSLALRFYRVDNAPHSKRHAMRILSVCDIKRHSAALHLAGEKGEVHPPRTHEVGSIAICNLAGERLKFFELLVGEGRSAEPYRVIRSWARTVEGYGAVPAFVNAFG